MAGVVTIAGHGLLPSDHCQCSFTVVAMLYSCCRVTLRIEYGYWMDIFVKKLGYRSMVSDAKFQPIILVAFDKSPGSTAKRAVGVSGRQYTVQLGVQREGVA